MSVEAPPEASFGRLETRILRRIAAERFAVYSRACLTAMAFLVPIAVHFAAGENFALVKLTIIWVLGVLAAGFELVRAVRLRRWPPMNAVILATLAFVAAYAVSTIFSLSPELSLLGRSGRFGGLLPHAVYVVVMLTVISAYWEAPARLVGLVGGTVAGSSVVSAYVVLQAAGLDWQPWTVGRGAAPDYAIGTLGNSNFAGGYLAICLPILLFLVVTARRRAWRVAVGALGAIHILALWHTRTRGGMLAAFAAGLFMVVLCRGRIPRWAMVASGLAAGAVFVGALLVIWHPGFEQPPGPLARVRTSTLQSRTFFWEGAGRIIVDHPIVGTGPDTFYAYYPRYRQSYQSERMPFAFADKPHNIYLEHASDTGVAGAGTYLVVVGLTLTYGIRKARKSEGTDRLLLVGLLGSFVAYLVQGMFSIDVPPLALMGWILIGSITCLADPRIEKRRSMLASEAPAKSLLPLGAISAAVALGAGSLVFVGVRPLMADVASSSGNLERAIELNPYEAEYRSRAAEADGFNVAASNDPPQQLRHLQSAHRRAVEAWKLQPANPNYTSNVATINTVWAQLVDPMRFRVADFWWRRAVAEDAGDPEMLGRYRDATAKMRALAADLERRAEASADDAAAWKLAAKAYVGVGDSTKARAATDELARLAPGDPELARIRAAAPK